MEHQSDALIPFVVHHAVACQVREVRVLEESGVSPRRPVQMKLKRSFRLVTRVQVTLSALPAPIVGCEREPRCWDFDQRAWISDGRSSCRALSEKSSKNAMFWEMMRELTWAEGSHHDG